MGHVVRKLVFVECEQHRNKPDCAYRESDQYQMVFAVYTVHFILGSELVSVAQQAYLSLTCLQTGRQVFSWNGLYRLPNL